MITIATTYYDNPLMLKEQLRYWNAYPDHVKEQVKFVIVDDGSPNYFAEKLLGIATMYNLCLVRIRQDIFQNTVGARNLAFTYADEGWVWNCDLDHIIPWQSMEQALSLKLNPECYYIPARRKMLPSNTHSPIRRHVDTYIMTRDLFWRAKGYNEEYVKYYYNGPASFFRSSLKRFAKKVELDTIHTLYFGSEIIEDASPLSGKEKRKLSYEEGIMNGKHSTLKFDYERVL